MTKVAIVGAGLIGRSWAIVFARAGFTVAMYDRAPGAGVAALDYIGARLPELSGAGLLADSPETVLGRIFVADSLADALRDVVHVQENGPERVADKAELFAAMDRLAPKGAVLASSTSGIPASAFTGNLPGRARCLVAHPVNPPYLLPLVELCPAPWTSAEVVEQTRTLMVAAGQVPATINKEIEGFVLNRLQVALVAEAFRLVRDGVISPADLDATMKHGLGLRWSFMGPFETIDLNAPGGVADYCARYGGLYETVVASQMTPCDFTPALVETIDGARRATLPLAEHGARQEWRDRRLMALAAHKATQAL
jgi:3-hydroxyacyl-CoA dehydrogenase